MIKKASSPVTTLDTGTPAVIYLCKKDKRLAKVIHMVGSITYTPHNDSFSFLVHEIIEQMLSIKAGAKIYSRLEHLCDGCVTPERISLLTPEQLCSIGTSASKAKAIKNLVSVVQDGTLCLEDLTNCSDADVIKQLTKLHGIGTWTAKMYLIFVLDRPDILPYEDGAFLQSYRWMYKTEDCNKEKIIDKCQKWKPYSSITSRFLYKALDVGFTKEEFHLFK